MTGRMLASLQFETKPDYEENLSQLTRLCDLAPRGSILLAPEVSLTGFDYANFDAAALFSAKADERLALASQNNKSIITTMIEKEGNSFYNVAKVFHRGALVHTQAKHKLFTLGDETRFFTAGTQEAIKIFELDGIKVALLICFELRFTDLWEKIKGADLILVPAQWGKIRTEHFKTLTKALAIANQAYIIASDASNEDTTGCSAVITPFGETHYNGNALMQTLPFDPKLLQKMRRYIDIGFFHG